MTGIALRGDKDLYIGAKERAVLEATRKAADRMLLAPLSVKRGASGLRLWRTTPTMLRTFPLMGGRYRGNQGGAPRSWPKTRAPTFCVENSIMVSTVAKISNPAPNVGVWAEFAL